MVEVAPIFPLEAQYASSTVDDPIFTQQSVIRLTCARAYVPRPRRRAGAQSQRYVRRRVRARSAGLSRHLDASHRSRPSVLTKDPGAAGRGGWRAICFAKLLDRYQLA